MNRRRIPTHKTVKDYIIPLLGVFIVLIIIINFMTGGWEKTTIQKPTSLTKIEIENTSGADVYVVNKNDKKSLIESTGEFYEGERLLVTKGILTLNNPKIILNESAELRLDGKNKYSLLNNDVFFETDSSIELSMVNAKAVSSPSSAFVATQNKLFSTIFVLKGNVTVSNNTDKTITVTPGRKIMVSNVENGKPGIDLDSLIGDIEDFQYEDNFFVVAGAPEYKELIESGNANSEGEDETIDELNASEIFELDIDDESISNVDTIKITWKVNSDKAVKVTLNEIEADMLDGQFKVQEFKLEKKVNDIVYKAFDADDEEIAKGVITIYSTAATGNDLNQSELENYPINPEYNFLIKNPSTTTESVFRIEGAVPAGKVSYITVNGFRLTKFRSGGTKWMYIANKDYDLMKEWINLYKINYYNSDNKVITSNLFILKKIEDKAVSNKTSN